MEKKKGKKNRYHHNSNRPNQKKALSLKKHFLQFLKSKNILLKSKIILPNLSKGLHHQYIPFLEELLQSNINLFTKIKINETKVNEYQIDSSENKKTSVIPVRLSSTYKKTINLFSMPTTVDHLHHISAITNPTLFANKHYCSKCGLQFSRYCHLQRHIMCATCCKPKNWFLGNRLIDIPQNVLKIQGDFKNKLKLSNSAIFFFSPMILAIKTIIFTSPV